MTRQQMSDDELVAYIEQQESTAQGQFTSSVADEQAKAMRYYLGQPMGNEEEGRSSAQSSDVWDVVEGLTPLILKPFVSSDDVVKFPPQGAEDEEAAEQESDYVNFVVTQKNDVFEQLVAWVKTGLLQKNGIVKYFWEKSRRVEVVRYFDQPEDVYTELIKDDDVEVVEHSEKPQTRQDGTPDIDPETGQQVVLHDVTLRHIDEYGEARYEVVPPEEFLIGRDARSPNPKKARFVQHRTRKTISELREMGYDIDDDLADGTTADPRLAPQATARQDSQDLPTLNDTSGDASGREVLFRETYMLVDYDGDGIAELRKVCMVGREVLANEETEEVPFCGWTPYQQAFKFSGRCPADETIELQDLKTTVLRQTLDNIYTINNNRTFVSEKVNMDDMLDNQIAGVVRVSGDKVGDHIQVAPIQPIGEITMPMIEYLDSAKENRTGFTRYNQGTDADSLNKTATGVRMITEAGNNRVELIARAFAEQGLKPLMLGIHGLCRRHGTQKETVRLRGKWVDIDPRTWKTRYDMSVSVGLGTADKSMQLQGQQLILQTQANLAQVGLVGPDQFLASASKLAELVGEKAPEKYFAKQQPAAAPDPMQNPEYMLEVAKLKLEERKVDQHDRELDQVDQKQGIEADNAYADALARHAELEMKARAPDIASEQQQQKHEQNLEATQVGAQAKAAAQGESAGPAKPAPKAPQRPPARPQQDQSLKDLHGKVDAIVEHLTAPVSVIRDGSSKAVGVQRGKRVTKIQRDESGRIAGAA